MEERNYGELMELEPIAVPVRRRRHAKESWAKKGIAIMLSAVLFGGVSSATFYGVDQLLQGEQSPQQAGPDSNSF